jgi:hypothetical protein
MRRKSQTHTKGATTMLNIRILLVSLSLVLASIGNSVSAVSAAANTGGVSEFQSEPRSTNLSSTPTKWKKVTFKMGPSIKYWKKVAQCETAQDWKNGGNWGGGLGIARSTWQGYGGHQFASHPSKATVLQQIVVANRIAVFGYQTNEFLTTEDRLANKPFYRSAVGFNGWGCIKNNNYLKPKFKTKYTVKLPVGDQFYCPQYEETFKKYALPAKVFSYIAWRESRCNPGAVNAIWENGKIVWTLNSNGSYDSGLLQINSSWFKTLREQFGYQPEDLMNPAVNALFASWILHFSSGRLKNWNIRAA